MRKTLFLSVSVILLLAACNQTPAPVAIDLEAEEAAAREMFTVLRDAMNTQDIENMFSMFTEDALIIGSDGSEILNKEEFKKMWSELSAEINFKFQLFGEQLFKMNPDGNSAIAVSQFYVPVMTANLPLRQVFNLNKVDGKWMVSFFSSSVIPKNEDLPKIMEALAVEE
jgi:ketosteroid isomerase-like protein